MFGAPVDDGNGNIGKPEMLYLTSEVDAEGKQQASMSLLKEGGGRATLNYDNTNALLGLIEDQGKYRFETNAQNSGVLKLMSSVDSVNILLDSNGEKAGYMFLNDSLGRRNLFMYSQPQGGAYLGMETSFPEIADAEGETKMRTSFQLNGGAQQPWINLLNRNSDGTVNFSLEEQLQGGFRQ